MLDIFQLKVHVAKSKHFFFFILFVLATLSHPPSSPHYKFHHESFQSKTNKAYISKHKFFNLIS